MTNEEFKEAIELVQRHQDWRRGAETEMENPKELGVSIDTVLKSARELSQLKDGTHPDMVLVPRGSCIEAMEDAFRSVYGIPISAAFRQHDNTVIANAFIQGWKNAMLSAAQKEGMK